MSDYDLSGLSTRSFEKLIQSIASKVLGPGTVTYGDGPDGGRETTFEGRMDYPSQADPWDGYCVIQAKFLQRPRNPSTDGRWALKELTGELKIFADRKKRRRPDYYIFATNVVLTPVQDQGWKDKAAALFKKYQQKVPLRDWAIWDFDEIGKFLDNFADIRTVYAAWITPGDVLSEVMEQLDPRKTDFLATMTNFLAKELRSDQYANLEQAGHSTEERIPLARVFVDLPIITQRFKEPHPHHREEEKDIELIALLMETASDPLDPASILQTELSPEDRPTRSQGPQPGRYVLVGGPGQGKTTVGQFACQLFRVALLQNRPSHLLPPEVREPLSALQEQCRTSPFLEPPKARRFPVRIALSEFASALNADRDLSLLVFIARQIERRTDRAVSPDELRNWLSFYPWFLVLDGLDEVPSSTNREDVLKKVEDFWIDAAQVNADVLVLATTRPQGYSDDFSPAYYRHLVLASLSPQRAMAYAQRLVDVRYAGEPDRQQKILTRLQKASTQEATARLMRSPLQITIMAALVDQTGNPPQDRWRLFHDYYEVIYNRERERPIPAAELLRDYKPNIDAIHHQVGLILQVESEWAGGTEAKLLADRFAGLVTGRLEEEGFSGQELHTLRERIIDAAANRLVFLVGLEAGQVGFEIRSLQEYMAAEAIMTGSQDKIQERLRRFAPIASWRNVFLFAAGRCFLQEQHLRDTIHTICIELNDQLAGPVGRVTLAGAVLALDLLEDGVALRQPKYARLLAQCAVRVLELPPAEIHARLADVCEGEVETIIRESFENKLAVPDSRSFAAWATLLALIGRGQHWASELAEQSWPSDPSQQLTILSLPTADRAQSWVDSRDDVVIKGNPPREASRFIQRSFHESPRRPVRFYEWIPWAFDRPGFELPPLDFPRWGFSFLLPSIDLVHRYALDMNVDSSNVHPGWLPMIEEVKFSQSPSLQALTDGLRRVAAVSEAFVPRPFRPYFSWVFGSCLVSARSQAELNDLVERAARGDLGDLRNWLAAENRWKERGVTLEDLLHLTDDRRPFDGEIAERGFPVAAAYHFGWTRGAKIPFIDEDFLSCLNDAPKVQRALAPRILLSFVSSRQTLSLQLFTKLAQLTISQEQSFPFDIVLLAAQKALRDEGWLDILDEMGKATTSYVGYFHRNVDETGLQALVTLFLRHPAHAGLLSLIAEGHTIYPLAVAAKIESLDLPGVRFEQYDDPKIRWAAVVLELIHGGLKKERAYELAVSTTILKSQGIGNLGRALAALFRSEQFDETTDHYLLELRRQLLDAQEVEQAPIIGALNNALRRRSSGVTEREVWQGLALPEKLSDLVATARS